MALTPFDHLLAVILVVVIPLRSRVVGFRRVARAAPEEQPRVRRQLYLQAMRIQSGLALALAVLWLAARPGPRTAAALGLGVRSISTFLAGAGAALVIALILFVQARRVSNNERSLERVRPKLERILLVLPHTVEERRLFLWLSLTAGVCEELLYRGFLFFYLGHWMPPLAGLAVSSVIFGLGHVYQGVRGVLLTGLVGAFFGAAYMLCGSIAPAMVLHAAGDMYSGWIGHAALRREAEAPGGPLTDPAYDLPRTP